jgi:uncharacterized protein
MTALRVALVVIALAGAAFWFVRCAGGRMLYPAPPTPIGEIALAPGARHAWLESAGARTEAILLSPTSRVDAERPLVIYTHGNGELIDLWVDQFAPLRDAGVSVLLVEYPGYGRSTGSPSEASIARTMTAAFDWAVTQPGVDRKHVVGWGRSLGGGAVCALARERPLAALVLESTFTSVRAIAWELFRIPGFLVRDAFDNLEVVRGFDGPILVLHGEGDRSIPVAHARALQAAAKNAVLKTLPCGHNDCDRPWDLLAKFLHVQ